MSITQMSLARTAVSAFLLKLDANNYLSTRPRIGRAERERQGLLSYKVGFKAMLR